MTRRVYFGSRLQRAESVKVGEAQWQLVGKNRELKEHIFYHKRDTGRVHWEWLKALNLQSTFSDKTNFLS